uniref:Sodium/calcium exchanger membrane region domain-containing protein n=1 Tax=Eptatretus burgeri TaxID=7764 RepID=A0A8C4QLD5_EPTBU
MATRAVLDGVKRIPVGCQSLEATTGCTTSEFGRGIYPDFDGVREDSLYNVTSTGQTRRLLQYEGDFGNDSHQQKNCTHPGLHEFPEDIFSQEERKHGAICLHVICAMYMFCALAIVCDDFFVPSLEKICERLQLSEDVAGATFMAAGSSAPELFTSIIGVFITKSDVGVGTIVGSAVFNILCIIGICGLFAGQVVLLTWWSLFRDSFFYTLSVIILILCIIDEKVFWWEAMTLVTLYSVYIMVMKFNVRIQQLTQQAITHLARYGNKEVGNRGEAEEGNISDATIILLNKAAPADPAAVSGGNQGPSRPDHIPAREDGGSWSPQGDNSVKGAMAWTGRAAEYEGEGSQSPALSAESLSPTEMKLDFPSASLRLMVTRKFHPRTRLCMAGRIIISEHQRLLRLRREPATGPVPWKRDGEKEDVKDEKEVNKTKDGGIIVAGTPSQENGRAFLGQEVALPAKNNNDEGEEVEGAQQREEEATAEEEEEGNELPLWAVPEGRFQKVFWLVCWPISVLLHFTVPKCNSGPWERCVMASFMLSTLWIAFFSYIMVWMVTVIGYTLGIPDVIMGITFLAAGTSVPDCMASLIVARQGLCNLCHCKTTLRNISEYNGALLQVKQPHALEFYNCNTHLIP